MNKFLGLRLTNIRKSKGLTQKELAQGIISKSYLSNIENGNKFPGKETLVFLCNRLELKTEEIVVEQPSSHELIRLLEKVFQALLYDELQTAKKLLQQVEKEYHLHREEAKLEIAYYLLLSSWYYKSWRYDEAKQISRIYLSTVKKVIPVKSDDQHLLRYYYFYQVQKNFNTNQYQKAVDAAEAFVALPFGEPIEKNIMQSNIPILYINLVQYENALAATTKFFDNLMLVSKEQQSHAVKVAYLEGFIYYEIGFYAQAEKAFEKALVLIEEYPAMKDHFHVLILYKQAHTFQKNNNKMAIEEVYDRIYIMLKNKDEANYTLTRNEILPMTELLVYYAENKQIDRAEYLLAFSKRLDCKFEETLYFIRYGDALCDLNRGDESSYETKIDNLLKKVDASNDPSFIARVKAQSSQYFSEKAMYKKSYSILKEEK
ncbi:helix-turn-helix domain-containing protein [Isobaculum melis]|uniref:Helix-turn-helix domain-containing protein n=1 Tax=Isobaculum melis TaxID=142588 RepID=A0A1H9TIG3_9LACT|nr:helix-turn-helix transcriptional regulator [Isobaculum melis]SER97130.1 Helix-turn-helix domain-containing protein [Isobaculum melis]